MQVDCATRASVGSPFGCLSGVERESALRLRRDAFIIVVVRCNVRIVFGHFDTGIVNSNLV